MALILLTLDNFFQKVKWQQYTKLIAFEQWLCNSSIKKDNFSTFVRKYLEWYSRNLSISSFRSKLSFLSMTMVRKKGFWVKTQFTGWKWEYSVLLKIMPGHFMAKKCAWLTRKIALLSRYLLSRSSITFGSQVFLSYWIHNHTNMYFECNLRMRLIPKKVWGIKNCSDWFKITLICS